MRSVLRRCSWSAPIMVLGMVLVAGRAEAQGCEPWIAKVVSVQGPVELQRGGEAGWRAAGFDATLCAGDQIRVGPLGRAAVQLADEAETLVRLDQRSTLSFPVERPFLLRLIEGVLHALSRVPHMLSIETPFVAARVEGTEFVLRVGKRETEVVVFEGRVRFENAAGGLVVSSQEAAVARQGAAPVRRLAVKPREAVEWALYYPPLVDPLLVNQVPERFAPTLRAAASAYRRNDVAATFAALERVPRGERGVSYFVFQAGLWLNIGRVGEAEGALAEAERAHPESGGVSALRSVIALVRDQKDEALRLAETGAMLDPDYPAPAGRTLLRLSRPLRDRKGPRTCSARGRSRPRGRAPPGARVGARVIAWRSRRGP